MPVARMKIPKPGDTARFRGTFSVAVARGSSIIFSTITVDSRNAAILETVHEFEKYHGRQYLLVFLDMLVERLNERQASVAAAAVRDYALTLQDAPARRSRKDEEPAPRLKRA
jgi:hypothetical protein